MSKEVSVNFTPRWLGLLGVIFVLCKVFEYGPIALWSWWLVLLPFYAGIAIILGVLAFGALVTGGFFGLAALDGAWRRRKRRIANEKDEVWRKLGGK
jgi:hypothetical protein